MRGLLVIAIVSSGCVVMAPAGLFGPPPAPPPAYQVSAQAPWSAASHVQLARAETTKVAPAAVPKAGLPEELVLSGKEVALLQVGYARSQYPELDQLRQALQKEQIFETAARQINRKLRLPRQIDVQLVDCGTVNAFYDPASSRIIVCYELFAYLAQTFKPVAKSNQELGNAIVGAAFFSFFHELGHALRDQLDLPLTGREEDAVDQLATLILLDDEARGVEMALDGAQWFLLNAKNRQAGADLPFWDEHSLDEQRYYNIACLIYGSDTGRYADLGKTIPEARAVRCPDEYRKIKSSWDKLLAPHLRTGALADDGGGSATPSTEPTIDPPVQPETQPAIDQPGTGATPAVDQPGTGATPAVDQPSTATDDAGCADVIEHMLEVAYSKSHADLTAMGAEATWDELVQTCAQQTSATYRACVLAAGDADTITACQN